MQNDDLTKKLQEVLGKMDRKTLQDNLNKALDILKNGNPEELAKQISSAIKSQQAGSIGGGEKPSLEKLNIDPEILRKLNNTEIEKMLKHIGNHSEEIKSQLKDAIK